MNGTFLFVCFRLKNVKFFFFFYVINVSFMIQDDEF